MPEALERSLRELGEALDYPATPDFAAHIAADIEPAAGPTRPRTAYNPVRRTLALAALTLLVAASAVLAASPGARDAVVELFGLDGATVKRVPRLPEVPSGAAGPERLGSRASLADAQQQVSFPILTGASGRPRRVRVSQAFRGGVVLYEQNGLFVVQFRGRAARQLLVKLAAEGTRIERLRIGGEPAIWLEGRPHVVFVRDRSGRLLEETIRRAGNVLLLERDGLLVRIEGAERRSAAVAFARSLG